jgi:predicted nuclease with TOPRIM domain
MDKKVIEFQNLIERRKQLSEVIYELTKLQTDLIEKIKLVQFELEATQDEYFDTQGELERLKNELELIDIELINFKFK